MTLPPRSRLRSSLAFDEENCETFEWLKAYPAAHHLLDAIETSFTPGCVLTEKEASDYAKATETCPMLPSRELEKISAPLVDAPEVSEVRNERQRQLQSAKQRLSLLKNQRNILQEAIAPKRTRAAQPLMKTKTDVMKTRNLLLRLRLKLDQLRDIALEDRHLVYPDKAIAEYVEKEKCHMEDIIAFATQNIQDERESTEDTSVMEKELQRVVRSYAEIRADQCRHEANLMRSTAILSALNTGEGAYLETSISSLQHLIKDLQAKGAKEIQTRAERTEDIEKKSLLNSIQQFALCETVKEQQKCLTVAKYCATAFRNQRLRVLAFGIASRVQLELHQSLNGELVGISEIAEGAGSPLSQGLHVPEESGVDESGRERQILKSDQNDMAIIRVIADLRERENFNAVVGALSKLSKEFRNGVGGNKKWLHLDSHPRFAILINELQELLTANGTALESLLREKNAILDGSSDHGGGLDRRWVHFLNSSK